jgi:hypothetical protein
MLDLCGKSDQGVDLILRIGCVESPEIVDQGPEASARVNICARGPAGSIYRDLAVDPNGKLLGRLGLGKILVYKVRILKRRIQIRA